MTPEQKRQKCRELYQKLGVDEVLRRLSVEDAPTSDFIDRLWKEYPKAGRSPRSTKHKASMALGRIPRSKRPSLSEAIHAVKAWSATDSWKQGYVPGLHTWIKDRSWLDTPEADKVVGFGFHQKSKPQQHPDLQPESEFQDPQEAAAFLKQIMNQ